MADVITRFKLETTQFDSKLRDSARSLSELTGKLTIAGKDFDRFAQKNVEAARALGNIQSGATNTKDKVKDLVGAFNDVARAYNQLTKEQQQTDFGKAMAGSLTQLKGRITEAKQELYGLGDAMDKDKSSGIDFNSVLTSLGQRFGINSELMSVMTSGTLASTAAVTAGAAAVAYAAKQWAEYNGEIAKQQSMTATITGLQGGDVEELTAGARALAQTYDVDFRQAIEAANTLIHQFGVNGEEALSLLQDGMQGMIQGDGPKLLSMIQQYAPAFRDAGISASQLVAVIQNSEGGLFTDQNMSAIVMGIRNIRLMTKNTSEALAKLGIDGEEMSQKLENGSMTIFEALRQVAGKIDDVGSGSKAAGEVMQTVFGRQGTMAGTKLGEAIANLNTNLEETKTQTGEVGENLRQVNEKTMELERSLQEVFGTAKWDDWNTSLKTFAIEGMTFTVDWVGKLIEVNKQWNLLWIGIRKAGEALGLFEGKSVSFGDIGKSVSNSISNIGKTKSAFTVTTDSSGKVISASRNGQDVTEEYLKSQATQTVPTVKPTTPKGGGKAGAAWAPIEMQSYNFRGVDTFGRSEKMVQADIAKWTNIKSNAEDEESRAAARAMVEKFTAELEQMKNEGDITKGLMGDAYSHNFGEDIEWANKEYQKLNQPQERGLSGQEKVEKGIGGVSQIASGLKQMGIKVPEEIEKAIAVMQGVMAVINGVQTVMEVLGTTSMATNTVALSANTAALVALTAAVNVNTGTNLIPFHNGGIVPHAATGMVIPGNDYSDRTPVLASSGELILNKAQQNSIAGQLTAAERGGGGYQGTPYVEGEKIFLGINNYLRRSGRGEIVTSR